MSEQMSDSRMRELGLTGLCLYRFEQALFRIIDLQIKAPASTNFYLNESLIPNIPTWINSKQKPLTLVHPYTKDEVDFEHDEAMLVLNVYIHNCLNHHYYDQDDEIQCSKYGDYCRKLQSIIVEHPSAAKMMKFLD